MNAKLDKNSERSFSDLPSDKPEYEKLDPSTKLEVFCEQCGIVKYTLGMYVALAGHPDEQNLRELVDAVHKTQLTKLEQEYFTEENFNPTKSKVVAIRPESPLQPVEFKWVPERDTQALDL